MFDERQNAEKFGDEVRPQAKQGDDDSLLDKTQNVEGFRDEEGLEGSQAKQVGVTSHHSSTTDKIQR
jgi:hypothetical protein